MPETTDVKRADDRNQEKVRKTSQGREVFKRLLGSRSAVIGLVFLGIFVIITIFADYIAPYDYKLLSGMPLQKPGAEHLFGTDQMGRDLFSRVVYGARYSISLGLVGTLIGMVIGMLFGCLAGYYGGLVDEIIMRLTDVIQSIPSILMSMAWSVVLGPGLFNTMLALGLSNVAAVARLQRASILNIRKMEYIDAATVTNCSDLRVVGRHIIPNAFAPVLVRASMDIGSVIISAAGLSFLGMGIQPPMPEWGALLSAGRDYIRNAPYLCLYPGVVLSVFVLAINLFGNGLRDAMDPKLKR